MTKPVRDLLAGLLLLLAGLGAGLHLSPLLFRPPACLPPMAREFARDHDGTAVVLVIGHAHTLRHPRRHATGEGWHVLTYPTPGAAQHAATDLARHIDRHAIERLAPCCKPKE